MEKVLMIYPSLAMFALTIGMVFYMGLCRFRAIRARQVSIKYYRTYNEGDQTDRLHLIGRHIQNHFEVPPLFHVGVVLTYAADAVTLFGVVCAWSYVGLRAVHSAIHLGSNNVTQRFFCFGASLLALVGVWGALAWRVLAQSHV